MNNFSIRLGLRKIALRVALPLGYFIEIVSPGALNIGLLYTIN